jgi:hypothetical protein
MKISSSIERKELSEVLQESTVNNTNRLDELLDRLKIKVISKSFTNDTKRCIWFTFKNEKWYQEGDTIDIHWTLFWLPGINFLKSKGYQKVKEPIENNVAVYLFKDQKRIGHYGICKKDNKVISKFGTTYVVEHPLELIPDIYGDEVIFLKKAEII